MIDLAQTSCLYHVFGGHFELFPWQRVVKSAKFNFLYFFKVIISLMSKQDLS